MNSLPIFTAKICAHRGNCVSCRDASKQWLRTIAPLFQLPPEWNGVPLDETVCPFGIPRGATAEQVRASVPARRSVHRLTPEQRAVRAEQAKARKAEHERKRLEKFHRLWGELHTATAPDAKLIAAVDSSLPCGECKREFQGYVKDNPPDFEKWEQWVLDLHNAVNVKLGRAKWTIEQARERWPAKTAGVLTGRHG